MKLLTAELLDRFAKVGSQADVRDPIIIAHYFNPVGSGDWYASEFDPEDKIFYGYTSIFGDWNDEWGSFSLEEFESLKLPFGLSIERDLYWNERPASQVDKIAKNWQPA